ncbi:MAG: 5-oxoprolinase subunit PxpA [Pseudomonadota bacterium]
MKININADLSEGFGAYDIGADSQLLDIVASANVACGMHGGDPGIMRETLMIAAERGVSVGAHPGFNDLWGFGRRQIDMKPDDLEYLVAYQIGAIMGMANYAGIAVTHVKAHGALNNMACVRSDYAEAIATAIKTVDDTLISLVMPGTELEKASQKYGLTIGREAFIDRTYEDDWTLTPRKLAGSVIKDPDLAARRAVEMVTNGGIQARSGEVLPIEFDSLCVHGDEPTSVAVAKACYDALTGAGVEIVPLPELV